MKKESSIYKRNVAHILNLIFNGKDTNQKISDFLKLKPSSIHEKIEYLKKNDLIIIQEANFQIFNQKIYNINPKKLNNLFFEWIEDNYPSYNGIKLPTNLFLIGLFLKSLRITSRNIEYIQKVSHSKISIIDSPKQSNLNEVFEFTFKIIKNMIYDLNYTKKILLSMKIGDDSSHLEKDKKEFIGFIKKIKIISEKQKDVDLKSFQEKIK